MDRGNKWRRAGLLVVAAGLGLAALPAESLAQGYQRYGPGFGVGPAPGYYYGLTPSVVDPALPESTLAAPQADAAMAGTQAMPPMGGFRRPYPYHLDYYRLRYGGSYAPYFGNIYGPPRVYAPGNFWPRPYGYGGGYY
jgi:hypothetical protein